MKKYNCVYVKRCGGDTCPVCKGYTTKTEIKRELKELTAKLDKTVDDKILIQNYTELLKGARK